MSYIDPGKKSQIALVAEHRTLQDIEKCLVSISNAFEAIQLLDDDMKCYGSIATLFNFVDLHKERVENELEEMVNAKR